MELPRPFFPSLKAHNGGGGWRHTLTLVTDRRVATKPSRTARDCPIPPCAAAAAAENVSQVILKDIHAIAQGGSCVAFPRIHCSGASQPQHTGLCAHSVSKWSCLAAAGGAQRVGQPGWACGHVRQPCTAPGGSRAWCASARVTRVGSVRPSCSGVVPPFNHGYVSRTQHFHFRSCSHPVRTMVVREGLLPHRPWAAVALAGRTWESPSDSARSRGVPEEPAR